MTTQHPRYEDISKESISWLSMVYNGDQMTGYLAMDTVNQGKEAQDSN